MKKTLHVESLPEQLKCSWLEYLIERDDICLEERRAPDGGTSYVFNVRLLQDESSASSAKKDRNTEHIERTLQCLMESELKDPSGVALFSKFSALVGDVPQQAPRTRLLPWVLKNIDDVYRAKWSALVHDGEGASVSYTNVFPVFVYEQFVKTYGIKTLVDRNTLDFLHSLIANRETNTHCQVFADFLDERYRPDELVFFLHCRHVLCDLYKKKQGLCYCFQTKREVQYYAQFFFDKVTALRTSFQVYEDQFCFPVEAIEVVKRAMEVYHDSATGLLDAPASLQLGDSQSPPFEQSLLG